MKVFLLDNYDSFTYNLVQLLARIGADVTVARNDQVTVAEIEGRTPDAIVISPGPSRPEKAGISVELAQRLGPSVPILGVCLGHQAIGIAFGADVVRVPPVHGKAWPVFHEGVGAFDGIGSPFDAARYHSLAVARDTLPPELEVTAWSEDGLIMGIRHRSHPVEGFQFHPESILTDVGEALVAGFLRRHQVLDTRDAETSARAGIVSTAGILPDAPDAPAGGYHPGHVRPIQPGRAVPSDQ
ncbi:MAG: anthranilate synthase component II [Candidatus Limnocylindria bacterium]